jgi:signal peptidase I
MPTLKPGDFVKYQNKTYWIVRVVNDKEIIILSLDAIDFDNPQGLNISKAIKVKTSQIEKYILEF